jgi:para-aminobenzoate synthetase/4-amino-4-deoxychorismate lyase
VPLLVDIDGSVLEASFANVFVIERGQLVTPPLDGRILPGTTRQVVLDMALDLGIRVGIERVDRDRLQTADGVFLTSSVRGVTLVGEVRDLRRWLEPSPAALAIREAYRDRIDARLKAVPDQPVAAAGGQPW